MRPVVNRSVVNWIVVAAALGSLYLGIREISRRQEEAATARRVEAEIASEARRREAEQAAYKLGDYTRRRQNEVTSLVDGANAGFRREDIAKYVEQATENGEVDVAKLREMLLPMAERAGALVRLDAELKRLASGVKPSENGQSAGQTAQSDSSIPVPAPAERPYNPCSSSRAQLGGVSSDGRVQRPFTCIDGPGGDRIPVYGEPGRSTVEPTPEQIEAAIAEAKRLKQ